MRSPCRRKGAYEQKERIMTNLRKWVAALLGSALSVAVAGRAMAECHTGGTESGAQPPRTLVLGSRSSGCIKLIQDQLAKSGVPVEMTGKFDATTEAAVKQFQTEKGLSKIDGKVGPETRRALGWER
jgi:peptidoglycan hydrolase-like protein with peptidoglycan-binding domain